MRRFIHKYGKWAVGERCQCGHARADHAARVVQIGDQSDRKEGLGPCAAAECRCAQFRRGRWIFEGERPGGDGDRRAG